MKKTKISVSARQCPLAIPTLLPFLIRMVIGLMFLVGGYGKLVSPEMFQGMLVNNLALTGVVGMIVYWVVVVFEGLGGIAVLLGKLAPRCLYKLALLGQFVIIVVAYFTVVIPGGDKPWFHINKCINAHINALVDGGVNYGTFIFSPQVSTWNYRV